MLFRSSILVGIGRGAKEGVLIRDADVLQRMSQVTVLLIDKTGTLTEGKPAVNTVIPLKEHSRETLLQLAASIEIHSEHPLAVAICRKAQEQGLELLPSSDFQSMSGKGVLGVVNSQSIALGNQALLSELQIDPEEISNQTLLLRQEGQTVVYLCIDKTVCGLFGISDPIRPQAQEAIRDLYREKMDVILATGDHSATAYRVANALNISKMEAELLPEGKNKKIQDLQFHSVCRVFPVFSRDVTGHSSHARFLVLRALKYDLNSISFSFLCHVVCVFAVMLACYFIKPF